MGRRQRAHRYPVARSDVNPARKPTALPARTASVSLGSAGYRGWRPRGKGRVMGVWRTVGRRRGAVARVAAALMAIGSVAMGSSPAASAAPSHLREFVIPGNTPGPQGIALGSDGALWFTEINLGIGRMTPTGSFTNYSLSQGAQPLDIVSGPDGALWFTETYDDRIGR